MSPASRIASSIGTGNAAAVATGKGRRDSSRRPVHPRADMDRQSPLDRRNPPACRRASDKLDRADSAARCRQSHEPCGTGKIVGARQHGACGRHQPRPKPHHGPLGQSAFLRCSIPRRSGKRLHRYIDPHLTRFGSVDTANGERQTDAVLGRLVLPLEHMADQQRNLRARQSDQRR